MLIRGRSDQFAYFQQLGIGSTDQSEDRISHYAGDAVLNTACVRIATYLKPTENDKGTSSPQKTVDRELHGTNEESKKRTKQLPDSRSSLMCSR